MSRTLHACCLILADSTRRLKWLGRLLVAIVKRRLENITLRLPAPACPQQEPFARPSSGFIKPHVSNARRKKGRLRPGRDHTDLRVTGKNSVATARC